MGLQSVPVTSGSKGVHLYAALDGSYTSEQVSDVAKELATSLEKDHPDEVISSMKKSQRKGKVFIDWSQNHWNKTTVAPYSPRGRPGSSDGPMWPPHAPGKSSRTPIWSIWTSGRSCSG